MSTPTQTRIPTQSPALAETTTAARGTAYALGATRVVVALLMTMHGLQGFGAFGGIDGAGAAVEALVWPAWWASVIELGAGALVLVGLWTRPAALLLSGSMAYAYFTVHQPTGLLPLQNMGEPAALYCWIFLLLAVAGPGVLALDNAVRLARARALPLIKAATQATSGTTRPS